MNKYLMVLAVLYFVGLQAAEESIEVIDTEQYSSKAAIDTFVGEIATDKESLAYIAQNYGNTDVAKVHALIFTCCKKGNKDALGKLIEKYKLAINGLNYERLALLHYACWRKNADIVKYLLDQGADIEIKDIWEENGVMHGGTPLHWACRRNNVEAVKLLLSRGANIESVDTKGATPLHWACMNFNIEVLIELLHHNPNLQAVDENGDTPLHYAFRWSSAWKVNYLIKNGANLQIANAAGLTPRQLQPDQGCCVIL